MRSDAPEELREFFDVLSRAFPTGLPDEDYRPLLVALDDGFSNRALAVLVSSFTGRHPLDVDNDHAAAMSIRKPDPARVDAVRDRLNAAGYVPDA